ERRGEDDPGEGVQGGADAITGGRSAPGQFGLSPNQRGHAPAPPIPAMREEALPVGEGAPLAAVHGGQAELRQPLAREPGEIGLPTAAGIRLEAPVGSGIGAYEGLAHLRSHFEMPLRYGWPQP